MYKTCPQTQQEFSVTKLEQKLWHAHDCPPPSLHPDHRRQLRLARRNNHHLHKRTCSLSGKSIISMYPQDAKFPVYSPECWWGNEFDARDLGRDYDFNRPFFDQFLDLQNSTPRVSLISTQSTNSDYTNFSGWGRNCYLTFTCGKCEDCYYLHRCWTSKDCADCDNCVDCELGYELIDCQKCYDSKFLQNCQNSTQCEYGYGLIGCQDCWGCWNSTKAQYCIANVQYTKKEYQEKIAEYRSHRSDFAHMWWQHLPRVARRSQAGPSTPNCSGANLANSQNAQSCFMGQHLEDCAHCVQVSHLKDCADATNDDNSELCVGVVGGESNYAGAFLDICWFCSDTTYSSLCMHSQNLFGCISLRKAQWCILNQQYTQAEYEALRLKIVEHMKSTGEWGQWWPMAQSPFAYNQSLANDEFPTTQETAHAKGLKWFSTPQAQYRGPAVSPPDDIAHTPDSITTQVLTCSTSQKPFRVVGAELRLAKKLNIALPQKSPLQRAEDRRNRRGQLGIWPSNCAQCQTGISSGHDPKASTGVLCETCWPEHKTTLY